MAERPDIGAIRERLRSGKLAKEDIEFLDQRLREYIELGDLGEIDGRRIVARLPNGMDIIK